jgi:hypothetical protein
MLSASIARAAFTSFGVSPMITTRHAASGDPICSAPRQAPMRSSSPRSM